MPKTGEYGGNMLIEHLRNTDGYSKRSRNKCRHYRKVDDYCLNYERNCTNVAHCMAYDDSPMGKGSVVSKSDKMIKEVKMLAFDKPSPNRIKEFENMMLIPLTKLCVNKSEFIEPSIEEMNVVVDYFNEHGELDKPIFVSCCGETYRVEDGYLQYRVAEELELIAIKAKMDDGKGNLLDHALRTHGESLSFHLGGNVKVVAYDIDTALLQKDDGKIVKMDIEYCIKKRLVSLIKT